MSYSYADAVKRAESLRPLVPKPWAFVPMGNPHDGYRIGVMNEDHPSITVTLDGDDDVKRLLDLYITALGASEATA